MQVQFKKHWINLCMLYGNYNLWCWCQATNSDNTENEGYVQAYTSGHSLLIGIIFHFKCSCSVSIFVFLIIFSLFLLQFTKINRNCLFWGSLFVHIIHAFQIQCGYFLIIENLYIQFPLANIWTSFFLILFFLTFVNICTTKKISAINIFTWRVSCLLNLLIFYICCGSMCFLFLHGLINLIILACSYLHDHCSSWVTRINFGAFTFHMWKEIRPSTFWFDSHEFYKWLFRIFVKWNWRVNAVFQFVFSWSKLRYILS